MKTELQHGWAQSFPANDLAHRWFLTASGQQFFPHALHISPINIEDIAHALSNICRFGGHCREFYSVAQHSVIVSQNVPQELALVALLHDATEAYLGDMIQPLKVRFPEFKALEHDLWERVSIAFNLPRRQPGNIPEVHEADCRALMTEKRDLMPAHEWSWGTFDQYQPFDSRIYPIAAPRAKELFLNRFNELTQP